MLAIAIPVLAVLVVGHMRAWTSLEEDTGGEMQALAGLAAADAERWFLETRDALNRTARHLAARGGEAGACETALRALSGSGGRWMRLAVVDRVGTRMCATGDAAWMALLRAAENTAARRIADGREFWVEAIGVEAFPAATSVLAGVPVTGPDGASTGALVVAVEAANFVPALRSGSGPLGRAVLLFVDDHRKSVAPDDLGVRATALPADSEVTALAGTDGNERGSGADGSEVVFGYADVPVAGGWMVASVPAAAADPQTRAALRDEFWSMLAALGALLLTLTLLARWFARPLGEITGALTRAAAGDRTAKAPEGGPREFVELGRHTNRMGEELARSSEALVRSSEALRRSEARYRLLFETSKDAIVGTERSGRIVFANEAVERLLGYAPAELIGRDVALLQPARLRDAFRAGVREFLETGITGGGRTTIETRALHRDGQEVAVEFTYSMLDSGTESLIVGILRDITERRRVFARLKESEARFRVLADSAPAFIWMTDADGRCTYVNRAWSLATGREPEQDFGTGWVDNVHPDDRPACKETATRAFAAKEPFILEFRMRHRDGTYRWQLSQGAPHFDDANCLVGYIGTAVDIHDRVVADQRIRRLTTLYAALSEVNEAILRLRAPTELFQRVCDIVVAHGFGGAIIALLDPDHRSVRVAAAAGKYAALVRGAAIPTDGGDPRHDIPMMLAVRTDAPFVSNDRANDPRTVPVRDPAVFAELRATAAFPLHQHGRVVGAFDVYAMEVNYFDDELVRLLELLAEDISFALQSLADQANRDRAEDALRQLNAALEERVRERTAALENANRELEAFSYSTSHDLRAPLRAISGFTDIVLERHAAGLDAEGLGYLRRVKAAAARMAQLINDLLDLSRVSRASFERTTTSLSDLADEIVAELREGQPDRSVEVRITPGLTAQCDPGLVRLLLANLLANAWKFTARRPYAVIEFGRLDGDGTRAFYVRDNGAGFAMEHADKLFAPFQRLHSEREFPGSGIGLALAQRVVHRHGGRIWAEAAPDAGAAFFFTLEA
jgi:hypothetical protein